MAGCRLYRLRSLLGVEVILLVILAIAGGYQLFALLACLKRLTFREKPSAFAPGVSILKPIRGADPAFFEAIRSHALIDYPEFEILFGIRDRATDTAVPHIERLICEFPSVSIRMVNVTTETLNGKVGSMIVADSLPVAAGLPKSGCGVGAPTAFQSAKCFFTSASSAAGSASPAITTTAFSGRYQRL